ncbi:hypothetical protein I7I50_12135 [Histoplasma capsulatum G186AR]|uniref:Uncharacterized protein n=1 Tax=Ajellomyces capsulatus TaxID=5037 RepID=A0A8H7YE25_AJECA|nr:hypothetical protein I7I52_11553 [Histoplasma capsulatum]QSS70488.1 hypothetical protein I7I50_12135 [Histoplasma capsulatum G186AR]
MTRPWGQRDKRHTSKLLLPPTSKSSIKLSLSYQQATKRGQVRPPDNLFRYRMLANGGSKYMYSNYMCSTYVQNMHIEQQYITLLCGTVRHLCTP